MKYGYDSNATRSNSSQLTDMAADTMASALNGGKLPSPMPALPSQNVDQAKATAAAAANAATQPKVSGGVPSGQETFYQGPGSSFAQDLLGNPHPVTEPGLAEYLQARRLAGQPLPPA